MSRAEAARPGGMDCQTLWGWIIRVSAEGPEGFMNRTLHGREC